LFCWSSRDNITGGSEELIEFKDGDEAGTGTTPEEVIGSKASEEDEDSSPETTGIDP